VKLLRICCAAMLLCAFSIAHPHERSESTSHWTLDNGELHGIVTARTREVTRLTLPDDSYASLAQILAAHVQRSVAASIDETACVSRQSPTVLESEPGYVRIDVRLRCGAGNRLTLKLDTFFAVAPSHHHFLYVEAGQARREAILTAAMPVAQLDLHPSNGNDTHFGQFVRMGIEHIVTGADHLAFLLALLISARTLRQVLAIVTGFTLGHSLTLSLAVSGIVQADRTAVECLIGLTIALAAAQNLIRGGREGRIAGPLAIAITGTLLLIPAELRPGMPAALIIALAVVAGGTVWLGSARRTEFSIPARFTMAMGFGLVHGLGFASALQDLHLPRSLLAQTLLGFNIGVEVGQLLVVTAAAVAITTVARWAPGLRRQAEPSAAVASATLLAAGLAWFLTRAIA